MTSDAASGSVDVEVEQTDRGWVIVHIVDGERKPIEPPHPDRESAEFAAKTHRDASDRWTGAAEQVSPQDRPENKATDGE